MFINEWKDFRLDCVWESQVILQPACADLDWMIPSFLYIFYKALYVPSSISSVSLCLTCDSLGVSILLSMQIYQHENSI